MRVLIVDDFAQLREFIRVGLSMMNVHDVHEAQDGNSAQTLLADLKGVDLIITDLSMPVVSGWDFIAAVRKDPRWKHIPILVVSGAVDTDDIIKMCASGATGVLAKPFSVATLRSKVERIVDGQKAEGEILILEDDADLAALLKDRFKAQLGVESFVAHRGDVALTRARYHRHIAVVSDIVMPDMNGFEFLAEMARHGTIVRPFVFFSAQLEHFMDATPMGIDAIFEKPYVEDLVEYLGNSIRTRRAVAG